MNNTTEKISAHIRDKVKEILEEMIKEERRAYLEENMETKANGYYLRNWLPYTNTLEIQALSRVTFL